MRYLKQITAAFENNIRRKNIYTSLEEASVRTWKKKLNEAISVWTEYTLTVNIVAKYHKIKE